MNDLASQLFTNCINCRYNYRSGKNIKGFGQKSHKHMVTFETFNILACLFEPLLFAGAYIVLLRVPRTRMPASVTSVATLCPPFHRTGCLPLCQAR